MTEPEERDSALLAEDVGKRFGDLEVLSGVDLSVEPGSVVAVVGPNGSGKTTLLRILAGVLAPSAGRVDRPGGTERPVGYLPQNPSFRAGFTVRETLAFYADLLAEPPAVEETLDRLGLGSVGDRRMDALSGGMRRLAGLGQATLGGPPAIVLDEPTGDLDPRMTRHIFGVVRDTADDGAGVVLATHDLSGAETADRVVVLDRGEVVARGPPEELADRRGDGSFEEAFLAVVGDEAAVRTGVVR